MVGKKKNNKIYFVCQKFAGLSSPQGSSARTVRALNSESD